MATLPEATRGAVHERTFFELSWSHVTWVSSTGGSLVGIGEACSHRLAARVVRWLALALRARGALAGARAAGSSQVFLRRVRQVDEAAQARLWKYLPFSVLTRAGDGPHQAHPPKARPRSGSQVPGESRPAPSAGM